MRCQRIAEDDKHTWPFLKRRRSTTRCFVYGALLYNALGCQTRWMAKQHSAHRVGVSPWVAVTYVNVCILAWIALTQKCEWALNVTLHYIKPLHNRRPHKTQMSGTHTHTRSPHPETSCMVLHQELHTLSLFCWVQSKVIKLWGERERNGTLGHLKVN